MTKLEIRYNTTDSTLFGVTLLKLDVGIDEAMLKALDLFDHNVAYILLKDDTRDDIIKIEKHNNHIEKSYMLNLFDLFSF